jgi:ArsR family transcriptional regulator, cadmium/lead-responsive transcriptional repressor
MTEQLDDELWSAVADPSRRRLLDLLISNGAVSASWLAAIKRLAEAAHAEAQGGERRDA